MHVSLRSTRRYLPSLLGLAASALIAGAAGQRAPTGRRSWLSHRSAWSILSATSVLSIGSAVSLLSIGSFASVLSIGSSNSVLSIGSDGGYLSIGASPRVRTRVSV
jgi:hypothetical protein